MAPLVPTSQPWVEKYRPRQLKDVAHQEEVIGLLTNTLQTAYELPHMVFYGPPGTGKTTSALAIAHQLYGPELYKSRVLELNASDDRGINVVRKKIKDFAAVAVGTAKKAGYPCPPHKIIILNEADSMTENAQNDLRFTMITYSSLTRFIFICNYISRIKKLAPRCAKFRFKPLSEEVRSNRILHICNEEGLNLDAQALSTLSSISQGDLRRAITYLQSAARLYGSSLSSKDLISVSGDQQGLQTVQKGNQKQKKTKKLQGMDDREWMYTGHPSPYSCTDEWIKKTEAFLNQAFAKVKGASRTFCPCRSCENRKRQTKEVMGKHLVKNGFTENYTRWIYHGEADRVRDEVVRQRIEACDADARVGEMLNDTAITPMLPQIRVRSTSARPTIRPRLTVTQLETQALKAQLEEETRRREQLEARMQQIEAKQQARIEEVQRQSQQQMAQFYFYMQSQLAQLGGTLPPMPWAPPVSPISESSCIGGGE